MRQCEPEEREVCMSLVCCSLKIIRLCVGGLLSSDPPASPEVSKAVSCGLRTRGVRCEDGAECGRALSLPAVATAISVSRHTLYYMYRRGLLKSVYLTRPLVLSSPPCFSVRLQGIF